MSDTKTSLKKQILGAAAGAAVAFVVYQSYTFVSGQITAQVTPPPIGSGIINGALVAPQYAAPMGMSGSPAVPSSWSSSSTVPFVMMASSASSSAMLPPAATGPAAGALAKVAVSSSSSSVWSSVGFVAASSSSVAPVIQRQQWSSPGGNPVRVQEIMLEEQVGAKHVAPVPVSSHPQGTLPKSGFGLDVVALMALGAVMGRKRLKHA